MLLTVEEIEAYAQAILDAVATAKALIMEAQSDESAPFCVQKTNICSENKPFSVEKKGENC